MSGCSTRALALRSTTAALTYGFGRLPLGDAVHMKPARGPLTQAPVIRESMRANHSAPPGPGAEYGPRAHVPMATLNDDTPADVSGHENTRSVDPPLWLAKYIVDCAPWVSRSEPWVVVEYHW